MNFHDLIKQAEDSTKNIRDKLLLDADERYKRKRDDLQREYAAERQSIIEAFGMDMPEND